MSNPINVVGTVATEPRLITTQSGVQLCTFRIASGERRFDRDKNSWIDGETNWFTVTTFRGLAQNAKESFSKGDRVIVSGRLRVRRWERDERSGTSVDIEADALGHDLRWGVSSFAKRVGADAEQPATDRQPSEHTGWATPADHDTPDQLAEQAGGDGFIPAVA